MNEGHCQLITGFSRDEYDDWYAILSCGHTQHMRHQPPWQNRPWVMTESGRQSHLGYEIICKKCMNEKG